MNRTDNLKNQVADTLKQHKTHLKRLCLKIHASPETGLEEYKASGWLREYFENNGFEINAGVGDLPTAFTACYGNGKPRIGLLAEYDALPQLGHACGHNIIAAASAGAAIAVKPAIDALGGTIVVIGSPSEEIHSGKELLIRRGVIEGLDAAMMVHPGNENITRIQTLACITLEVEFKGRQAHASANPEEGVNALEAMLLSFNAINSLRQHIPDSARVHGIITDGGQAANIVPARSAAMFMVRATNTGYLEELKSKVINCFKGAAAATGTKLKYHWADVYCQPMKSNACLAAAFNRNMAVTGRQMETGNRDFASTDMGNISQIVPSIHPIIAIAPRGTPLHSTGFLKAAASGEAIKAVEDAALAMALTITDILSDAELLESIQDEFNHSR
ncbi:MAG: M20 family metallopeptidase [Dehalococcoidaceae bacterium]|nr:M20 family metallopeptidase [Dehalococcoidaceae bacterium]